MNQFFRTEPQKLLKESDEQLQLFWLGHDLFTSDPLAFTGNFRIVVLISIPPKACASLCYGRTPWIMHCALLAGNLSILSAHPHPFQSPALRSPQNQPNALVRMCRDAIQSFLTSGLYAQPARRLSSCRRFCWTISTMAILHHPVSTVANTWDEKRPYRKHFPHINDNRALNSSPNHSLYGEALRP